ncbi:hypothetical protein K663_14875 [Sphingobium sp. MI1205]|nr:hypothetical protein K663_14875 [Sphingobium sp. MI1205]
MQALSPDQFEAWVARAVPGEDVVYCTGLRPSEAIGAAVRALHERGLVTMTTKRADEGFRFIAQRLPDPPRRVPERRGRFVRREIRGRYTAERMILKILVTAADKGHPCPTNGELARRVGLAGAASASYRMRRLVAAGKIAIEEPSPLERRVVTIAATGKQTRRAML